MRLTILIDEDDAVPCVCRFRHFGGAEIVVVPTAKGRAFVEALHRAKIPVRLGDVNDDGEHESTR